MSLKPASSSLRFLLKIVVSVAALFLLLNFLYVPSCGRFACGWTPSWWPRPASAAQEACPDSLSGAISSTRWAAERLASIREEKVTTGLLYDEDGTEHRFVSGGDATSAKVEALLRERGARFPMAGPHPAVFHAETKAAVHMRESDTRVAVMVINNAKGVCAGQQGLSCDEVLALLLPPGARLVVWSDKAIKDGQPQIYTGRTS